MKTEFCLFSLDNDILAEARSLEHSNSMWKVRDGGE